MSVGIIEVTGINHKNQLAVIGSLSECGCVHRLKGHWVFSWSKGERKTRQRLEGGVAQVQGAKSGIKGHHHNSCNRQSSGGKGENGQKKNGDQ